MEDEERRFVLIENDVRAYLSQWLREFQQIAVEFDLSSPHMCCSDDRSDDRSVLFSLTLCRSLCHSLCDSLDVALSFPLALYRTLSISLCISLSLTPSLCDLLDVALSRHHSWSITLHCSL